MPQKEHKALKDELGHSDLKKHVALVHEGEKDFSCDECPKKC